MSLISLELTDGEFNKVTRIVRQACGINLKKGKEALVRARLMKRLYALGMKSFREYLSYLESAGGRQELGNMVDVMTTNKTGFFREQEHFTYLAERILPALKRHRVRLWTAACSSGEEPYSLAIVLRERVPDIDRRDVRILATDISLQMLEKGRKALYGKESLGGIPPGLLQKYFVKERKVSGDHYRIKDEVRALVHMAWLNLIDSWPMRGLFEVIFCRNVLIYFDRATQQNLIGRFWDILEPGGHLFVGHSEGLSALSHKFSYVQPAVYRK